VRDPVSLRAKLNALKSSGVSNLQILSDFDMTITKEILGDGRKADSIFKAIQDSRFMTPEIVS